MKRAIAMLCAGLACGGLAWPAAGQVSVRSRNVIGVVRMELPSGLSLVSTPFQQVGNGGAQTIAEIFGSQLPDLSEVHLFAPGEGYLTYTFFGGEWYDSQMQSGAGSTPMLRGDGVWVKNAGGEPVTLLITGEVPESEQEDVELPVGLRLVSFAFPVDTSSIDWIGLAPDDLDEIHLFDPASGYVSYTYFGGTWFDGGMSPSVILIAPGSAFWYDSRAEKLWSQPRTYTLD